MKKLKALLAAALACVFALSLAGCMPEQSEEPAADELVLSLVEVDTTNAKTEFFVGEQFSTEGLVVTRSGRNLTQETVFYQEEVPLDECTIDSSAFKSDTVGEYVITVSYTLGEVTKSDEYTVSVVRPVRPYRLILDESGAKKMFGIGEEFSSDGLKATAFDYDYSAQKELEPYDVTASIAVDSSAYNAEVAGSYEIVVSYTKDETTIQASYNVSVKVGAGLEIVLPEDAVVDANGAMSVDLQKGGTTVDFGDWVVNRVNANGGVDKVVTEDITFEVYNAATPVVVNGTSFTATEGGAYNVWAVLEGYQLPDSEETFTLKSFVIIYVMDSLKSITFNADASGTLVTQPAGSDIISKTWTFTATYSSGATKQLTAEDVVIEGLTTTAVTAAGVANISYTEPNAKGDSVSANTTVAYTITEKVIVPGQTNKYSFSLEELKAALGGATVEDKTELTSEAFNGSNAFITATIADPKKDVYRIQSSYDCIEINKGTLSVTFEGTGTLKIAARSTSNSNVSDIGLIDEAGNYVSAVYDTANTNIKAVNGYYTVTGNDFIEMTFEITQPGTYTIISNISGDNNRAVRINTIEMEDTISAAASEHTSIFSLEELKAALGGATVEDKTELTSEAFNGSNAFITATIADPKKDVYRIQSSYDCIEINKGTLSVTFEGTGTLKIAARSTSNSNVSDIGLIDEAGNYVSAVYDTANTNIKAVNGYYTVTGNDFIEMTFEITQPGTYTIISNISGDNNRAVRINTIVMVDNY